MNGMAMIALLSLALLGEGAVVMLLCLGVRRLKGRVQNVGSAMGIVVLSQLAEWIMFPVAASYGLRAFFSTLVLATAVSAGVALVLIHVCMRVSWAQAAWLTLVTLLAAGLVTRAMIFIPSLFVMEC